MHRLYESLFATSVHRHLDNETLLERTNILWHFYGNMIHIKYTPHYCTTLWNCQFKKLDFGVFSLTYLHKYSDWSFLSNNLFLIIYTFLSTSLSLSNIKIRCNLVRSNTYILILNHTLHHSNKNLAFTFCVYLIIALKIIYTTEHHRHIAKQLIIPKTIAANITTSFSNL